MDRRLTLGSLLQGSCGGDLLRQGTLGYEGIPAPRIRNIGWPEDDRSPIRKEAIEDPTAWTANCTGGGRAGRYVPGLAACQDDDPAEQL